MKREEFVSHEVFAHSSGTRVILWSHRDEAGVYFDVSCGLGTHLDAAGNKVEEGARLSSKEEAFKAVELYVRRQKSWSSTTTLDCQPSLLRAPRFVPSRFRCQAGRRRSVLDGQLRQRVRQA